MNKQDKATEKLAEETVATFQRMSQEIKHLRNVQSELLEACKIALGAFENNNAIDWNILQDAISKAEGLK